MKKKIEIEEKTVRDLKKIIIITEREKRTKKKLRKNEEKLKKNEEPKKKLREEKKIQETQRNK
jgi:hypothetical protein